MSRRIVIGTAGHIDHGKSRLVEALTGIDPDRLEEEHRRGITIDLGFAHLSLDDGLEAGLVDVPGHERFVRTMVAGAAGVDLVLLVVAVDEGVMPQTLEHLDVCRLLGVPRGVVALTKCDLLPGLDAGWADLVRADLEAAVRGTFLEGAPVVEVSAESGEGLEALVAALSRSAREASARPDDGPLFLPVDRAFTMKGFGTVVTGTMLSGTLEADSEVTLAPGGETLRVRGLEVHGKRADAARAGQRTAVNLSGVEKDAVSRGEVLIAPGAAPWGRLFDVELESLPALDRPLPARSRFSFHAGTAHAQATVTLLSARRLAPGGRAFAQVALDRPVAVLAGQPFLLRGSRILAGRGRTVAGGRILAIAERRRRASRANAVDGLAELASDEEAPRVETLVRLAGARGLTEAELPYRAALPRRRVARLLAELGSRRRVVLVDTTSRLHVHADLIASLADDAAARLTAHHETDPVSTGLSKEALRSSLEGPPSPKLFHRVLSLLEERGEVEVLADRVRTHGTGRALEGDDARDGGRLLALLERARLAPPRAADAAGTLDIAPARASALLARLAEEGRAVRVKDDLFFDAGVIADLEKRLLAHLEANGEISTQEFKALTGATRKHLIPLSEYFDRERVTLRVGDKRILRGGAAGSEKAAG